MPAPLRVQRGRRPCLVICVGALLLVFVCTLLVLMCTVFVCGLVACVGGPGACVGSFRARIELVWRVRWWVYSSIPTSCWGYGTANGSLPRTLSTAWVTADAMPDVALRRGVSRVLAADRMAPAGASRS